MMKGGFQIIVSIILLGGFFLQSCQEKPIKVEKNIQYVSGADEITYLKLGKEITDTVGKTLKGNLVKAMQERGPVGAVKFCNAQAMGLSSTYAEKYGTELKRVSDKNRNPINAPNEAEKMVLADFRYLLEKGEPLSPRVAIDAEGRKNFYAPILTGGVCLTCHGPVEMMQPELVTLIDSLYPSDLARGYKANELRGIWSIKFKNS